MNRSLDAGWSRWPAPAKINVFLQIIGRRADGYHLLQTLFQLLDWGDTVAIRVRTDGRITRLAGATGVAEDADLAVRAARLLQRETGCRFGADLNIEKRIPLGGGFGGGSSDAATTLVALDQLWGTALSQPELQRLGAQLGADVPVFVAGRSAWAEGVGERLTPLSLPQRYYLLLDSGVQVPTAELFQAPDLTRNAQPIKMPGPNSDWPTGNAFEAVLRRSAPRIVAALQALSQFGRGQVTGTGGGCFVSFTEAHVAEAAADQLGRQWSVWLARGVNCSPLQRACEAHRANGVRLPV